jgi:hypothetical protein
MKKAKALVPPLNNAVAGLLDLARQHVPEQELLSLLVHDPGTGDYLIAYRRVLRGGLESLLEVPTDGVPLIASFDISENLEASHNWSEWTPTRRWFSVLTGCIELLSLHHFVPFSATLARLLVDCFVLQAGGTEPCPCELLRPILREVQLTADLHQRALATVAELLLGTQWPTDIETGCLALNALHAQFQMWGNEDGQRNYYYANRPEFIWGAVLKRQQLPTWVALVVEHFPSQPEAAKLVRERLIQEGNAWLQSTRRPKP